MGKKLTEQLFSKQKQRQLGHIAECLLSVIKCHHWLKVLPHWLRETFKQMLTHWFNLFWQCSTGVVFRAMDKLRQCFLWSTHPICFTNRVRSVTGLTHYLHYVWRNVWTSIMDDPVSTAGRCRQSPVDQPVAVDVLCKKHTHTKENSFNFVHTKTL